MSLLLWRSRRTTNEWKVRYDNLQNKQQDVSVILDTLSGKQQTEVWVSSTITTVPLFPQNLKKAWQYFWFFQKFKTLRKLRFWVFTFSGPWKRVVGHTQSKKWYNNLVFFKPLKTGGFFVVIRHPFIHLFWLKAPYNNAQWILTRGGHC